MSSSNKIFAVLEAVVSHQDSGLNFAAVVSTTGLPKASAHRILKALTDLGYLSLSPETKRYRGTLKLAALGAEVTSNFDLRDYVHPQLLKLHQETSHTSNMGIRNGEVGIYVDKIESLDYGIKLFSEIGKSFPLHCTGMGKILLAFGEAEDIERILSRPLKAFTEKTITDQAVLKAELEEIRTEGYAVDREEITRGIMCVAAPVFGLQGKIVCAISAAFPSYINSDRGITREIEALKRHADAISGMLKRR